MISVVEKLCIGSTHNSTDRLVAVNNALELESSYGGFSELHGSSVMQSHIHCFCSRQSAMNYRRTNEHATSMEERCKEHHGKVPQARMRLVAEWTLRLRWRSAPRRRALLDRDVVTRWGRHWVNDRYKDRQGPELAVCAWDARWRLLMGHHERGRGEP